jgi:uncharacterized protein YjbJ (UPF0337 family)/cation transport regulator ChaB
MTTKKGKPKKSELPGTVARSGKKARRTFAKAHDSALEEYGNEKQARKVAYSALEQTHRKSGQGARHRGAVDDVEEAAGAGHRRRQPAVTPDTERCAVLTGPSRVQAHEKHTPHERPTGSPERSCKMAENEKSEDLRGKAKEAVGKATNDEDLERQGKVDQAKSDLKEAGEKVKDAFKH